MTNRKVKLPVDLQEALVSLYQHMVEEGYIDEYDFTGYNSACESKPVKIEIGGVEVLSIDIIMNQKSNGEYDGVEGLNY